MSGQDYDKDLYLLVVGSGNTSRDNWEDNVEDFIFGDRDSREVTVVVPYTQDMGSGMDVVLNQWAVGADRNDPRYPIIAFVEPEAGHRSISSAKESTLLDNENGTVAVSAAMEEAMGYLVDKKLENQEVAVVVLYDENKDVELVGDIKNYQGIPVYNIDGMVDAFPGFRTTDQILDEERKREEFDAKEAIRLAAEKELEKLQAEANKSDEPVKPAPRKRAVKKAVAAVPEEKPLTAPRKTAAKKVASPPKAVEELLKEHPGGLDEFRVPSNPNDGINRGLPTPEQQPVRGKVAEKSELPKELEPVKALTPKPTVEEYKAAVASGALVPEDLPGPDEVPDLWKDVSKAQVSLPVTHYSVSKESLAELSEGIQEMALSFSKTMGAMTKIIEGK